MEQFIAMAAGKLGISQDLVGKAVGLVLNLIKENAAGGDMQDLLAKLPGAEGLMGGTETQSAPGGGLLGGIAGALGGALGGAGADKLGALTQLQNSGLDAGQLGSLMTMFKDYAGEQAGGELVERLTSGLPGLGAD